MPRQLHASVSLSCSRHGGGEGDITTPGGERPRAPPMARLPATPDPSPLPRPAQDAPPAFNDSNAFSNHTGMLLRR